MFGGGHVSAAGQTQHYSPYASSSPDAGTCGNDRTAATFNREFKVSSRPNGDGTYTLTEDFKNGSFVTNAVANLGACETSGGKLRIAYLHTI